MAASVNPSVYGQTVTFTATISAQAPGQGTPSGTMQFMDGSTALGTPQTIAGGAATFQVSLLPPGGHPITAVYSGDTNFDPATSPVLMQQVNKAQTTVSLAVS